MLLTVRNLSTVIAVAIAFVTSGCGDSEENSYVVSPPTDVGKPDQLPSFASLSLYSADSPFNQKISPNPEIDPNSAILVNGLASVGQLILQIKKFAAPVYLADENTPRHDVKLECGPTWELGVSMMKDVPVPDWAEPSFDGEPGDPLPSGCGEDSDQDNHMFILDLSTRCEYDFWQARKTNGQWLASWGNSIRMDSNGIYPKGFSARGSGFAFLGGVIWPDELQAGRIEHALAFNYPFPKAGGPVAPATDSDGESERVDALPEGALLQLNPDLNLDELNVTPSEKAIARALQEYGMILVDGGGARDVGLQAIDPRSVAGNPYQGILPDEEWVPLPNISLQEFRVMKLPPQISSWQDNLELVSSSCGVLQ